LLVQAVQQVVLVVAVVEVLVDYYLELQH